VSSILLYPRPANTVTLTHEITLPAVAVAALTEPGHEGKAYRITGPQALTYQEVAEIVSDATGKKVRYDNSLENYSRFLKDLGLDVNEVLELDASVAKGADDGSAVINTIFELTGRQPIRIWTIRRGLFTTF
jgi:uncharacterized protein YbjT (DUF2867 family)